MYFLREAKKSDLEPLLGLANVGITSLPPNSKELGQKIERSIASFKSAPDRPNDEYYLFVLEEFESQKIVGTSAIRATAPTIPTFLKLTEHLPNVEVPHPKYATRLKLHTEIPDASELCGLVLDENVQAKGLGTLLSRGRFFYIADHLTRFHSTLIADLRGIMTAEGVCLFWEHIGRLFCPLSFSEVEDLYRVKPQDLFALLPTHSIYLSLLSIEVQENIGRPHPKSVPAFELLKKEGFHEGKEIHPLDGGPRLQAELLEIRSIRDGQIGILSEEVSVNGFFALVSRTSSPFRACITELAELPQGKVALSPEGRKALQANPHDPVRYIRLK